MSRQLPLEYFIADHISLAGYIPGDNRVLLQCLQELVQGRGEFLTYLWGRPATGRTHLLQAVCRERRAAGGQSLYLPLLEADDLHPDIFEGLEHFDIICLDDINGILGQAPWEEALFHLINRIRSGGQARLVIAGDQPVAGLPVQLPDLQSRLAWGVVFQVLELADEDKALALRQRASEKGFALGDDIINYLFRHQARDIGSLLTLVEQIDQAALAEKRPVTLPLVRKVLAEVGV